MFSRVFCMTKCVFVRNLAKKKSIWDNSGYQGKPKEYKGLEEFYPGTRKFDSLQKN